VIQSMTAAGAIRTDFSEAYAMGQFRLGKGSFARVHIARPRAQRQWPGNENDGPKFPEAVAKAFIPSRSGQAQRAKKEAAALLAIGPHPHVVSFHGIFASKSDMGQHWTLLLGYCAEGNLSHRLSKHGVLDSLQAKQLATSMLAALAHIHSKKYMHRDVKPDNVLINSTGCFVLADCGEAVPISEGRLAKVCGTPGYLAPEVLNRRHYNELVDLFSLGAMMYLCVCGQLLFPGQSSRDILRLNAQGAFDLDLHVSKHLSSAGLEFLDKLLAKEPSERSSAQDALGHAWFREGNKDPAVKATEASGIQKDSTSDYSSHSDTCCVDPSTNCLDASHNKAKQSGLRSEAKRSKHTLVSSFKGLLRRPGLAGKKVIPITSKESHSQTQGSDIEVCTLEVRGAHKRLATRTSHAVAWIRGKPKCQGCVSEKDLPHKLTPVVCNW